MKEIVVDATIENVDVVTDFLNEELEFINCSIKNRNQIDIAIDELFGNIAKYAYDDDNGSVKVQFDYDESKKEISITFIDSGIPYNPLEKEDPDVTLSAAQRKIGGLGIFLVKRTMDEMTYKYVNNSNMLTIKKVINIEGE